MIYKFFEIKIVRISVPYNPYTVGLEEMFSNPGMKVAFKTKFAIINFLRNPKYITDIFEKSGIYKKIIIAAVKMITA